MALVFGGKRGKDGQIMGKAWMNLASLGLGLAAWLLPLVAVALFKKARGRLSSVLTTVSALCCALSLYLQICYQNHLVCGGNSRGCDGFFKWIQSGGVVCRGKRYLTQMRFACTISFEINTKEKKL